MDDRWQCPRCLVNYWREMPPRVRADRAERLRCPECKLLFATNGTPSGYYSAGAKNGPARVWLINPHRPQHQGAAQHPVSVNDSPLQSGDEQFAFHEGNSTQTRGMGK